MTTATKAAVDRAAKVTARRDELLDEKGRLMREAAERHARRDPIGEIAGRLGDIDAELLGLHVHQARREAGQLRARELLGNAAYQVKLQDALALWGPWAAVAQANAALGGEGVRLPELPPFVNDHLGQLKGWLRAMHRYGIIDLATLPPGIRALAERQ
jgi:hypothetical protein